MSSSTYVVDYSPEEIKKAHEVLYNEGLRMRIQVAGKEYVEKSLAAAKDPFSKPMQEVLQHVLPHRSHTVFLTFRIVRCRGLLGLGMGSSRP